MTKQVFALLTYHREVNGDLHCKLLMPVDIHYRATWGDVHGTSERRSMVYNIDTSVYEIECVLLSDFSHSVILAQTVITFTERFRNTDDYSITLALYSNGAVSAISVGCQVIIREYA